MGLVIVGVLAACSDNALPPAPLASAPSASSATQLSLPSSDISAARVGTRSIGAALSCPPYPSLISATNLATNADFESGSTTWVIWPPGPTPPPSAATGWVMHTNNAQAKIGTRLVPSTVPGKNAPGMMVQVNARGNESGIIQQIGGTPAKLMFSVWVKVMRGYVGIAANPDPQAPTSHTVSTGEWEQLRVCTDGTQGTGYFYILQQDPLGGAFFIDRVEIRELF